MSYFFKILLYIFSIPKTIYFNFKYFPPRQAIKFPIMVCHNVKLINTKGTIKIESPLKFAQVRIGFDNHKDNKLFSSFDLRGNLIFKNKATFANGIKLLIIGELHIGDNFIAAGTNTQINCGLKMHFGDDILISWNCFFTDGDGHNIYNDKGERTNRDKEVIIGNHVWICLGVSIFKGAQIGNNSIIAANSTVLGKFDKDNCVVGGNPAGVLKEIFEWKH